MFSVGRLVGGGSKGFRKLGAQGFSGSRQVSVLLGLALTLDGFAAGVGEAAVRTLELGGATVPEPTEIEAEVTKRMEAAFHKRASRKGPDSIDRRDKTNAMSRKSRFLHQTQAAEALGVS
jgi:hypothetical protein